jgi:hypothetical protein
MYVCMHTRPPHCFHICANTCRPEKDCTDEFGDVGSEGRLHASLGSYHLSLNSLKTSIIPWAALSQVKFYSVTSIDSPESEATLKASSSHEIRQRADKWHATILLMLTAISPRRVFFDFMRSNLRPFGTSTSRSALATGLHARLKD